MNKIGAYNLYKVVFLLHRCYIINIIFMKHICIFSYYLMYYTPCKIMTTHNRLIHV